MTKPPAYQPERPGFWAEFFGWLDANAPDLAKQFDLAIPLAIEHQQFIYERCISHAEQTGEISRLKAQINQMVARNPGRLLERGEFDNRQFQLIARAKDDKSGKQFELGVLRPKNEPICFSNQCGRAYVLSWQELAKLAVEAGIDKAVVA